MKIEVNVEKKYAFLILGALLIIGAVVIGVAYNSGGPPSVVGHSADEIEGVCKSDGTGCPNNEANILFSDDFISGVSEFNWQYGSGNPILTTSGNHPGILDAAATSISANLFIDPTSNFEVELYAQIKSSTTSFLFGLQGEDTFNNIAEFQYSSAVPFRTVTRSSSSSESIVNLGSIAPYVGSWHKFKVAKIDANTIKFYIDGAEVASHTTGIPTQPMRIGFRNVLVDRVGLKMSDLSR